MLISNLYRLILMPSEPTKTHQVNRTSKKKEKPKCSITFSQVDPAVENKQNTKSNNYTIYYNKSNTQWFLYFINKGTVKLIEISDYPKLEKAFEHLKSLQKKLEQLTKKDKENIVNEITAFHEMTNESEYVKKNADNDKGKKDNIQTGAKKLNIIEEFQNSIKIDKREACISLLMNLKRSDLVDRLFPDSNIELTSAYQLDSDENIIQRFSNLNSVYNYFDSNKQNNLQYIRIYNGLKLYYDFLSPNNLRDEIIANYAYKILLLFNKTNTDNPFNTIDNFIKSYNFSHANQPYHDILEFTLHANHYDINIAKWQKIINSGGREGLVLFQRANDIKRTFGIDPEDFHNAKKLISQLKYKRSSEDVEFAELCETYNVPEDIFDKCLDFKKTITFKMSDHLPDIMLDGADVADADSKNYCIVKLPVNDPRSLILGNIVFCCMHVGGHSEKCIRDGLTLANNGFYVLLKSIKKRTNQQPINPDKSINYKDFEMLGVGYSWLSDNRDSLVFDSWENLRESDDSVAFSLLTEFGKKIIDINQGIFQVNIGLGGKSPKLFTNKTISEKMASGFFYGDADIQAIVYRDEKRFEETLEKLDQDIHMLDKIDLEDVSYYKFVIKHNPKLLPKLQEYFDQSKVKSLINNIRSVGLTETLQDPRVHTLIALYLGFRSEDSDYYIDKFYSLSLNDLLKNSVESNFDTELRRPQYRLLLDYLPSLDILAMLNVNWQSNPIICQSLLSIKDDHELSIFITLLTNYNDIINQNPKSLRMIVSKLNVLKEVDTTIIGNLLLINDLENLKLEIDKLIVANKISTNFQKAIYNQALQLVTEFDIYDDRGFEKFHDKLGFILEPLSTVREEKDDIILSTDDDDVIKSTLKVTALLIKLKALVLKGINADNFDLAQSYIGDINKAVSYSHHYNKSILAYYKNQANKIYEFLILASILEANKNVTLKYVSILKAFIQDIPSKSNFYKALQNGLGEIVAILMHTDLWSHNLINSIYTATKDLSKDAMQGLNDFIKNLDLEINLTKNILFLAIKYYINLYNTHAIQDEKNAEPTSCSEMPDGEMSYNSNSVIDEDTQIPGARSYPTYEYQPVLDLLRKGQLLGIIDDAYNLLNANPSKFYNLLQIYIILHQVGIPSTKITEILSNNIAHLDSITETIDELSLAGIKHPGCYTAILNHQQDCKQLLVAFITLNKVNSLSDENINLLLKNTSAALKISRQISSMSELSDKSFTTFGNTDRENVSIDVRESINLPKKPT